MSASVSDEQGERQLKLFHSLLRASDYRGSDVRLDSGELLRPHCFPRRSLDPSKWTWYEVLAHRFKDPEHINVLELRAALSMLRWRTRSARRVRTRFVHLVDSQVALAVLVKGRSSSWRLNRVLCQVNALTLASGLLPCYAYVRSTWNTADKPSRRWEGPHPERRASIPRRPRRPVKPVQKRSPVRRNVKYEQDFDSTLGYPGERPAPRGDHVKRKQRERAFPQTRQEQFPGRRTRSQRALARKGVSLRAAVLLPRTVQAYQTAFATMWNWIGRSPPISVHSTRTYDALLATYIEEAWVSGETRGDAGNASSASVTVYPELRSRGLLSES